jgi:hypothetical protein
MRPRCFRRTGDGFDMKTNTNQTTAIALPASMSLRSFRHCNHKYGRQKLFSSQYQALAVSSLICVCVMCTWALPLTWMVGDAMEAVEIIIASLPCLSAGLETRSMQRKSCFLKSYVMFRVCFLEQRMLCSMQYLRITPRPFILSSIFSQVVRSRKLRAGADVFTYTHKLPKT